MYYGQGSSQNTHSVGHVFFFLREEGKKHTSYKMFQTLVFAGNME